MLACVEDRTFYYPISGGERTELDITPNIVYYESDDGKITAGFADGIFYGIGNSGDVIYSTDVSGYLKESDSLIVDMSFDEGRIVCVLSGSESYDVLIIDEAGGEVLYDHSVNADIEPAARLCGDTLYTAAAKAVDYVGTVTDITATDTVSGKDLWSVSLNDFDTISCMMTASDDRLYISGEFGMSKCDLAVLDKATGELKNRYVYKRSIVTGWIMDEWYFYVLSDGSVFYCDDTTDDEFTDSFYTSAPELQIVDAKLIDGNLFFMFDHTDYITRYTKEISRYAVKADSYYEVHEFNAEFADEELEKREEFGVNVNFVDSASYSSDMKYIYVIFTDHTAGIYDAETAQRVSTFIDADDEFLELRYSDLTGSYILTGSRSAILDKDMKVICETEKIICDEGDGFIMENPESEQYKVPYYNVSRLCEAADEYLNGYEPGASVKQKYGLL